MAGPRRAARPSGRDVAAPRCGRRCPHCKWRRAPEAEARRGGAARGAGASMARCGRLRAGTAAKLRRWRKGHSSDCNPETRRHRLAARSRFYSRPTGERPGGRAGARWGEAQDWKGP